ncbi:uncharacterized protein LOC104855786 isoform X1 [Fukomys damarensis]|uniref:uncharacterized protein LOC104855786 isoform X1 n=1 Tax=Fukomys damarensis TaxID=885580 RepID=UPI00053F37EE|nr:uncharacterized protein LOC104855786 isoform X1 [Fukomys damarensis]XP_010613047.1 uncharacterized protein LOC104855786 isoform X1 [Fukomys damarensis]
MHRPQWAWGSEGYQTPSRPHTVELDHRSRMSQAIGTELQPVRHGQQSHFCTGLKTAGKRGPAAAWPVIRTLQDTSRWCLHKTSRSQRDPGCSVPIRKRCRMEGWDRHEDLAHASIGASARTLVQRSRALLFLPFCETTDSKMNIKHGTDVCDGGVETNNLSTGKTALNSDFLTTSKNKTQQQQQQPKNTSQTWFSQACWHVSVIPVPREAEAEGL